MCATEKPGTQEHIFSVDVEDDINLLYRNFTGDSIAPTEYVIRNTNTILELLDKHTTRATFFVLGQIAEEYPELVQAMSNSGHEIGTHGYTHRLITQLTPEEFRQEIRDSKTRLEQITGKEVKSHRAPAFTIVKDTLWALEILLEEGIRYDSSIYPIQGRRYGIIDSRLEIHELDTPSGPIIEVPLSCTDILGKRRACCGGGYNRLFPFLLNDYAFRKIAKDRPVVLYTHPYELNPEIPDVLKGIMNTLSPKQKMHYFLQRVRRGSVKAKLDSFLQRYSFAPVTVVADAILGKP